MDIKAKLRPFYVAKMLYAAAGEEQLLTERKKIGEIPPGHAFDLDAKYIIHTVGPAWVDGNHGEREILHLSLGKRPLFLSRGLYLVHQETNKEEPQCTELFLEI